MPKKDNGFLLTPADGRKVEQIKSLLDQAVQEKKRAGQVLALLDAQQKLMGMLHWFLARDLL